MESCAPPPINGTKSKDIHGHLFTISVIQRGLLSLLFYLIYINELYSCSKLLTLIFTDDIPALASHKLRHTFLRIK
jgi:hypothetical protein